MAKPLLALPIDLQFALGLEDGRAWAGFTAATGRRFQNHYILSWQFCEGPAGCDQPLSACDAFGCNYEYPSARYPGASEGVDAEYVDLTTGVPARSGARAFDDRQSTSHGEVARRVG